MGLHLFAIYFWQLLLASLQLLVTPFYAFRKIISECKGVWLFSVFILTENKNGDENMFS